MLFGLMNIPMTFQSYIDTALGDYLDNFTICYFDNILVYIDTNELKKHIKYMYKVLQKL